MRLLQIYGTDKFQRHRRDSFLWGLILVVVLVLPVFAAEARRSVEAARCAQDQGKFWQYYDTLFKESPKLSPGDLNRYAAQVGIDFKKFDACLSARRIKIRYNGTSMRADALESRGHRLSSSTDDPYTERSPSRRLSV
jgi:hypothetical protein